jgi:hypothetical protein
LVTALKLHGIRGRLALADKTFWRDVRVAVLAGVIVLGISAAGTYALGWWPSLWRAIQHVLEFLWGALSYSVTLPLSLVVVICLAALTTTWLWRRSTRRAQTVSVSFVAPPAAAPFTPDEVQDGVLKLLAQLDGELLHVDSIPRNLRVGTLIISHALDGLAGAGLIEPRYGSYRTPAVALTTRGRDYVIAAGLAPKTPMMS